MQLFVFEFEHIWTYWNTIEFPAEILRASNYVVPRCSWNKVCCTCRKRTSGKCSHQNLKYTYAIICHNMPHTIITTLPDTPHCVRFIPSRLPTGVDTSSHTLSSKLQRWKHQSAQISARIHHEMLAQPLTSSHIFSCNSGTQSSEGGGGSEGGMLGTNAREGSEDSVEQRGTKRNQRLNAMTKYDQWFF